MESLHLSWKMQQLGYPRTGSAEVSLSQEIAKEQNVKTELPATFGVPSRLRSSMAILTSEHIESSVAWISC